MPVFEMARGIELRRVRLTLKIDGPDGRFTVTGRFPLVVERRRTGPETWLTIAYHPARQDEWFPLDDDAVAERASRHFQRMWTDLHRDEAFGLRTCGKDAIRAVAFDARPPRVAVEDEDTRDVTGPTGTGKTEMARTLARCLYGDEARLLRFDMSEFNGPDAASRLVGDRHAPHGLLTRRVRTQPFCVVLFDEIEKAHPAVHNLLLQLFEDGRLTDAAGHVADFTHAVVIMTSNLGARRQRAAGFGAPVDGIRRDVAQAVRDHFAPELFNRIDRIVPFDPLAKTDAMRIAHKALAQLAARRGLVERRIAVEANTAFYEDIVERAFDPRDGARPLKRWLEQHVGERLVRAILTGPPASMRHWRLYFRGDELELHDETLVEAEPLDAGYPFEALTRARPDALRAELAKARRFFEAPATEIRLGALRDRIGHALRGGGGGQVFELETVRHKLEALTVEVEAWTEDVEARADRIQTELSAHRGERGAGGRSAPPRRDRVLDALAEVTFARHLLDRIEDPDLHTAEIEIVRLGHAHATAAFGIRDDDWATQLCRIYATHRGTLDAIAAIDADGRCGRWQAGEDHPRLVDTLLARGVARAVVRIVGPGVLDYYRHETGCHLFTSAAGGTEIVRVTVAPIDREIEVDARLADHEIGVAAFEAALERGATLPPNPRSLLPAVRHMRFDAAHHGTCGPLEIEDYVVGHARVHPSTTPLAALRRIWRLHMTREESRA